MKSNTIALGAALVAIVLSLTSLIWVATPRTTVETPAPGGVTNYDELTLKAPYGTTTLAVYGSSTAFGGCVETNATSTATKINLKYLPIATSTANGYVVWNYGTCK